MIVFNSAPYTGKETEYMQQAIQNGKLCGDVDPDDLERYTGAYLTPVPGGVGKLTVISLMKNVVKSYEIFNS